MPNLGPIIIDTNLLLLLVVGSTKRAYVDTHKRVSNRFTLQDFDNIGILISLYSDIVFVPHVLAEVSNLARQIEDPAKSEILSKLKEFIAATQELPIASLHGSYREEYGRFGLTDAILLHACSSAIEEVTFTLLTVDEKLANRAIALGYKAEYYEDWK